MRREKVNVGGRRDGEKGRGEGRGGEGIGAVEWQEGGGEEPSKHSRRGPSAVVLRLESERVALLDKAVARKIFQRKRGGGGCGLTTCQ